MYVTHYCGDKIRNRVRTLIELGPVTDEPKPISIPIFEIYLILIMIFFSYVNHSCTNYNAQAVLSGFENGEPNLAFYSSRDIPRFEEIKINYGDTYFDEALRCANESCNLLI